MKKLLVVAMAGALVATVSTFLTFGLTQAQDASQSGAAAPGAVSAGVLDQANAGRVAERMDMSLEGATGAGLIEPTSADESTFVVTQKGATRLGLATQTGLTAQQITAIVATLVAGVFIISELDRSKDARSPLSPATPMSPKG